MSAAVYFAMEPAKLRFKIGLTENLPRRLYTISGWMSFDFLMSRRLRLPARAQAARVEEELKKAFARFNIPCEFSERNEEGSGELFSLQCAYKVFAYLEDNRALLCSAGEIEPIPLQWMSPPEHPRFLASGSKPRAMHTEWYLKDRNLHLL